MASRPRIYVGNIPFTATENDIRAFFADHSSKIVEVKIISDHETGRPRGFAFVEVLTPEDMHAAIADLNNLEMGGRRATVSEAKERERGGKGGGRNRDDRGGRGAGERRSDRD